MTPTSFERLLKDLVGIDAEAIGSSAIERAVKERQTAGRFADSAAYWDLLQISDSERQLLVEAVVVPETWFFRDRGAFDALPQVATSQPQSSRSDKVFRVLSVPCSTGEEPYSIAIALWEAPLFSRQYQIDAVDVSGRAIARAEAATFGENSFRGEDLAFRDRYFSRIAGGFQLAADIRQKVRFRQANLLAPEFLAGAEPYDAIFCRNLFIYFDRPTQHRAIAALAKLLTPDGVLFVGSSETGVFLDQNFSSANLTKAFAFRRKVDEPPPAILRPSAGIPKRPSHALAARPHSRSAATAIAPAQAHRVTRVMPEPPLPIERAYQLADQGHFAEAARVCDDHVKREGPSARAFYLLGLVRDASGNESDAESFYRKALYLDPRHREALVHLALLMDRKGDPSSAQVLRNRARRLEAAAGVAE